MEDRATCRISSPARRQLAASRHRHGRRGRRRAAPDGRRRRRAAGRARLRADGADVRRAGLRAPPATWSSRAWRSRRATPSRSCTGGVGRGRHELSMTGPDDCRGRRQAGRRPRRAARRGRRRARRGAIPATGPDRQPVHTVYVPADRLRRRAGPALRHRRRSRCSTGTPTPSPRLVADAATVERVRAKLASEPVEDLRVDFEDGYVGRTDADEDADVVQAARALAPQPARRRGGAPSTGSGSRASRPRRAAAGSAR